MKTLTSLIIPFVVILFALFYATGGHASPFNETLCPADYTEPGLLSDQSAACYEQCKPGFAGIGPTCVDVTLTDCIDKGTCVATPSCPAGQSQELGLCLNSCPANYHTLANICSQAKPAGWQDGGVFFFRNVPKRVCIGWFCFNTTVYETRNKHVYSRISADLPNQCNAGYSYILGVCVKSSLDAYVRDHIIKFNVEQTNTASFSRNVQLSDSEADNNFSVAIVSDTQLPWDDTSEDAQNGDTSLEALWANSRAHNLSMVQALNDLYYTRQHTDSPLAFTVMNGDLTAYFHPHEASEFRAFYDKGFTWAYPDVLQSEVFLGLGNHDYENNLGSCQSFSSDQDRCVKNAINLIRGAVFKNYVASMPAAKIESYDAQSLAYSWNQGQYHFVQLHNSPSYSIPHLGISKPINWLKTDLARAAARGQAIIINMHKPDTDNSEFLQAIDGLPVVAIFAGHLHNKIGKIRDVQTPSGNTIPLFLSGSADHKTLLVADFEPGKVTVTAMSTEGGQATELSEPVALDTTIVAKPIPSNMNWQKIVGSKKDLSIDGNLMCGTNDKDEIWCSDNGDIMKPDWFRVPGSLKQVSVRNGIIFGVNVNGVMYYRTNPRSGNWVAMNGRATQVVHDGNRFCHANSAGNIYCAEGAPSARMNWRQIPGNKKELALHGNLMCGTNAKDNIHCADNGSIMNPNWFHIPGKLRQISVRNGIIFGVNANGIMYYRTNPHSGNWVPINGRATQITHDGNRVCHANRVGNIYCATW